mmetsp:Transcript_21534/g.38550  ORF Transcript_21534/g.38550 Transcript_21534/m.38550 type:complete len:450 (-) Transcript_21534:83-1432(-)
METEATSKRGATSRVRNTRPAQNYRMKREKQKQQQQELLSLPLETITDHTESTTNSSNHTRDHTHRNSMMFSEALLSYFQLLAIEKETDCENVNIVVDNARIPLIYDTNEQCSGMGGCEDPATFQERMSRSLSDIPSMSFPPAFLKDASNNSFSNSSSKWESFNSSSSSDISLSIPHRTWDLDECATIRKKTAPLRGRRETLAHASSLDSTAKMLRELPLEVTSSHSTSTHSSSNGSRSEHGSRTKQDLDVSFHSDECDDEDLPSLKYFDPYNRNEPHPRVVLRRISEGSVDFLQPYQEEANEAAEDDGVKEFFDDGDDSDVDQGNDEEGSLEDTDSEDELEGSSSRRIGTVAYDRWNNLSPGGDSPKRQLSPAILRKMNNTGHWQNNHMRFLSYNGSPRTLVDFPLPPTLTSSGRSKFDEERMNQILESTGRILGDRSRNHTLSNKKV